MNSIQTNINTLNFHLLTALGLSHDSAEVVMDRIGELETENRALHEDKARLDWVEANYADLHCNMSEKWTLWHHGSQQDELPTVRSAIDAARKSP